MRCDELQSEMGKMQQPLQGVDGRIRRVFIVSKGITSPWDASLMQASFTSDCIGYQSYGFRQLSDLLFTS